jgi:hypothetical protein
VGERKPEEEDGDGYPGGGIEGGWEGEGGEVGEGGDEWMEEVEEVKGVKESLPVDPTWLRLDESKMPLEYVRWCPMIRERKREKEREERGNDGKKERRALEKDGERQRNIAMERERRDRLRKAPLSSSSPCITPALPSSPPPPSLPLLFPSS